MTGDDLSFDCSYNTIEFSFGKEHDINVLSARFRRYIGFLQKELRANGHLVTGAGINPHHAVNRNEPIPNGRYRMLFHHLSSYPMYRNRKAFHTMPNFGLIACASQTHIDVSEEELTTAINAFSRIEPLKALLFANSVYGDYLCVRDHLWRDSLHGLNPHNVDSYQEEVGSVEELVDYIRSMSLFCLDRDGKYINIAPTPLEEYFSAGSIKGEYYYGTGYADIVFEPRIEDLEYLRSYKFVDLTFRGTLELRSICEQPVSEVFAAPAFHAGLKANLPVFAEYLRENRIYPEGFTLQELRDAFVRKDLPPWADRERLSGALLDLLEIASAGLALRGYGEEHFLEPLYRRAENLLSPGREMVEGIAAGKPESYYINKYGEL